MSVGRARTADPEDSGLCRRADDVCDCLDSSLFRPNISFLVLFSVDTAPGFSHFNRLSHFTRGTTSLSVPELGANRMDRAHQLQLVFVARTVLSESKVQAVD